MGQLEMDINDIKIWLGYLCDIGIQSPLFWPLTILPAALFRRLNLRHIQDRPDTVALLHHLEGVVDLAQLLTVGDELVDLQLAVQVVLNEPRQLRPTLDTTESASLPLATCDKLEC